MACNDKTTDCAPCRDCPPPPDPVLPRCDITLPDGTFNNATVVVDGGCITAVSEGRAPQYTPDPCCAETGGGGGGGNDEPCDCPPGEDGDNATITIGQVFSVDAGEEAEIVNVGSETHAVLDFYLPRGDAGESGEGFDGVTDDRGGIYIEDGAIVGLPATWPPALYIQAIAYPTEVSFTASAPNNDTGLVEMELDLRNYDNNLRQWVESKINDATTPLQNQIDALQQTVSAMQSTINGLQNQINQCC